MSWLPAGYVGCDTCGAQRVGVEDRDATIQMIRAAGWRHMKGTTIGGQDFETILCPGCAKEERRRPRKSVDPQEETLPLDFEEMRIVVGKQGYSSR